MAPNNPLTCHGNEKTMNLNTLLLTNIQSSPYFKVNLFEMKTYHQVIDEIYYKVEHLEPWERGSRKTAGQTGMCGGVRGVGAGGIVSSAYCLLYKLFTLKLTKKQVIGLITHTDSPYIRGLGFMYIRYTQNPADLWDWYKDYLSDEEEVDVKAGSGHVMMIGEMIRQWMTKLEWYSTLFPRIPVPIQKQIEANLREYDSENPRVGMGNVAAAQGEEEVVPYEEEAGFGAAQRASHLQESPPRGNSTEPRRRPDNRLTPPFDIAKEMDRPAESRHKRSRSRDRKQHKDSRGRRSHSRERGKRSHSRDRGKRSHSRDRGKRSRRDRSRSRERHHRRHRRSRSHDRHRSHRDRRSKSRERRSRSRDRGSKSRDKGHRESSFDRELRRQKERVNNQR